MKRRAVRKSDLPRSNTFIPDTEWRYIVDNYLEKMSVKEIADKYGRTVKAIESILFAKIPANYTEGGIRTSPIEKLKKTHSRLDPKRDLSRKDISYLTYLRVRERPLPPGDCAIVLNVHLSTIEKALEEFGGSSPKGEEGLLPESVIEQTAIRKES